MFFTSTLKKVPKCTYTLLHTSVNRCVFVQRWFARIDKPNESFLSLFVRMNPCCSFLSVSQACHSVCLSRKRTPSSSYCGLKTQYKPAPFHFTAVWKSDYRDLTFRWGRQSVTANTLMSLFFYTMICSCVQRLSCKQELLWKLVLLAHARLESADNKLLSAWSGHFHITLHFFTFVCHPRFIL